MRKAFPQGLIHSKRQLQRGGIDQNAGGWLAEFERQAVQLSQLVAENGGESRRYRAGIRQTAILETILQDHAHILITPSQGRGLGHSTGAILEPGLDETA